MCVGVVLIQAVRQFDCRQKAKEQVDERTKVEEERDGREDWWELLAGKSRELFRLEEDRRKCSHVELKP